MKAFRVAFALGLLLPLSLNSARAQEPTEKAPLVPAPVVPEYEPPVGVKRALGTLSFQDAMPIEKELAGAQKLMMLSNGVLYIHSDLDTDADGSPRATEIDKWGQLQTSFSYPKMTGQEQYVDAEKVPFFVLPGGFYQEYGIKLGDLGVLLYKDKIVYGMFADVGPKKKIGEASVKAVEMLGHNPWNKTHTQIVSGIDKDVVLLVFPGTALPDLTPETVIAHVESKAKELFKAVGGVTEAE
jgi:hypothetical protein